MEKPVLFVSFSGGRTSAYMCYLIKKHFWRWFNLVFIFANTGQEEEETLIFVDRVDKWIELDLIWVEAVINPAKRKATKHRIVDFERAHRGDQLFDDLCSKYGVPNKSYLHCTRELKTAPIHSWAKENLPPGYFTAIGMRSDEPKRVALTEPRLKKLKTLPRHNPAHRFVYPLFYLGVDKLGVDDFWESQNFDLGLEDYEGNCKWCYKKSNKKHCKLIAEKPENYIVPLKLEMKYSMVGSKNGAPRKIFREHRNTAQLIQYANFMNETRYSNRLLDEGSAGCESHCEPMQLDFFEVVS